ncbi:MAG: peptide ABC transporter substrate-binding protein, partial [Anaerolineales bacterium]
VHAHDESISAYLQALDYAKETEDYGRAARTFMKLGLTYHNALQFAESRQAFEEGFIYWQRSAEAQASAAQSVAPHPLRLALDPPTSLDPGAASDFQSGMYTDQLFSGLVRLTPEMSIVPDVSRSWDVLEDGKKYRFHLREDVLWSDGQPLTSGDFEFAWKRTLDPEFSSPKSDMLLDIKGAADFNSGKGSVDGVGVRAVDDHTLEVELERPTGYFLQLAAHSGFFPVPKHVTASNNEHWADDPNIITNGPYRLDSFDADQGLSLKRNPAYHGIFTGNVEEIQVAFRDSGADDLPDMYKEDEIDAQLMYMLSAEERDRSRHTHTDEYLTAPVLSILYLGFDVSRPPFDDARVRRALCSAIDRETLAEIAYRGYYAPAIGGLVPPGLPSHLPETGQQFDPGSAAQLLEEAGYPNGRGFPDIECLGTISGLGDPVREHLKTHWQQHLGVEIEWQLLEWPSYMKRLHESPPHVYTTGWLADYADPDNFLRVALLSALNGWENEAYDEMVEAARSSLDHAERMDLYERAQRILADEVPVLPIVYLRGHYLVKPWLTRFPVSAMRVNYWEDAVIEPHD